MSTPQAQHPTTSIDPATDVGLLALSVTDLERSIGFYSEAIGLTLLQRDGSHASLGVDGKSLLLLSEQPGAQPWPRGGRSYTGLYHFAILTPTRVALGQWLQHWLGLGYPVPGQGDHLVSEALYLEDPDGHGIEIYRDRPRSEWTWENGQVRMGVDPVDMRGLLTEAQQAGEPWQGMPSGTKLGHMHLQVNDVTQAAEFYQDVLGFDIVAAMPSALFASAGGYHHHIGMNVWHSRGASPPPADSVRLMLYTIDLPTEDARRDVLGRLDAAGISYSQSGEVVALKDPAQNTILLRVGDSDPQAALALLDRFGIE